MMWSWRVAAPIVALMVVSVTPVAHAEPEFPDVSSFAAVELKDYGVGLDFLGNSQGYQFTSPAGYRCRVYHVAKAYPDKFGQCWGNLPGTTENVVLVSDSQEAHFETRDLTTLDKYSVWSDGHEVEKTFEPGDYKLLPVGGRIYDPSSGTCVVDVQMTACITEQNPTNGDRHGFLLSPEGYRLF
ncbi:hypothetical protein CCUG60885_00308 [Mycobacteroides salmoniphilum]|uniref:Secreted protein n=1 Tax=Mycobacteroides salmoniphilum TaxID=404941 RepID=A0A4R8SLC1_9MYCO|nr:hypothetical protein CCUG60885_00308 [Mycobacteroides salmoniphilum]TEA02969.1 hypothetical protein CCUG60883_03592 [Mycobacteroides salmoniphilum]